MLNALSSQISNNNVNRRVGAASGACPHRYLLSSSLPDEEVKWI